MRTRGATVSMHYVLPVFSPSFFFCSSLDSSVWTYAILTFSCSLSARASVASLIPVPWAEVSDFVLLGSSSPGLYSVGVRLFSSAKSSNSSVSRRPWRDVSSKQTVAMTNWPPFSSSKRVSTCSSRLKEKVEGFFARKFHFFFMFIHFTKRFSRDSYRVENKGSLVHVSSCSETGYIRDDPNYHSPLGRTV